MRSFITKPVIIFILVLALFPKETWAAAPVIRGLVQTETFTAIPGVWVKWQDNSDQRKWGRSDDGAAGAVAPTYPNTDYAGKVCGGVWYQDPDSPVGWWWTPCCSDVNGQEFACPIYSNVRYVQTSNSPVTYYSGDNSSNYIFPSWQGDSSGNDVDIGGGYILQGIDQNGRHAQVVNNWIDSNLDTAGDTFQATIFSDPQPPIVPDPQRDRKSHPAPNQNLTNIQYLEDAPNNGYNTFGCYINPHTISVVTDVSRTSGSYQPDKRTFYNLSNSQAVANTDFTYVAATASPACTVSWPTPSTSGNIVTISVTLVATNMHHTDGSEDWDTVSLYLDNILVDPRYGSVSGNTTTYKIPDITAGNHTLKFRVHDTNPLFTTTYTYSGYPYPSSSPNPNVDCTPSTSFTTTLPTLILNPPTCPSSNQASLSWISNGATSYNVRVDDYISGISATLVDPANPATTLPNNCGAAVTHDVCRNGYRIAGMNVNVTPDVQYSWWMESVDSAGNISPTYTGNPFTCTSAGPVIGPKIDSLTIGNVAPDPSFSPGPSPARISGLQTSEGGSNWYNPMSIRLDVTPGSGNIKLYATAFYDKNQGQYSVQPALSSLSAIEGQIDADPIRGFLLAYSAQDCLNQTGNCYVDGKTVSNSNSSLTYFLTGRYYVYVKGSGWKDLKYYPTGYEVYDNSLPAKLLYKAYQLSNGSYFATWQMRLYKDFQSKSMYTPGFVIDSNNLTGFLTDL